MLAGSFATELNGIFLIVGFDNGIDTCSVLKVYRFPLVLFFVTGIVRVGHGFCSCVYSDQSDILIRTLRTEKSTLQW
jgi:hypothetical protein